MKNLGLGPNLAVILLGVVILITFAIAVVMANRGQFRKRKSRGERHKLDLFGRADKDDEPPARG